MTLTLTSDLSFLLAQKHVLFDLLVTHAWTHITGLNLCAFRTITPLLHQYASVLIYNKEKQLSNTPDAIRLTSTFFLERKPHVKNFIILSLSPKDRIRKRDAVDVFQMCYL